MFSVLASSMVYSSNTDRVNQRTVQIVSVVTPLSTQFSGDRPHTGWITIMIMCLSRVTCLSMDCLVQRGPHHLLIKLFTLTDSVQRQAIVASFMPFYCKVYYSFILNDYLTLLCFRLRTRESYVKYRYFTIVCRTVTSIVVWLYNTIYWILQMCVFLSIYHWFFWNTYTFHLHLNSYVIVCFRPSSYNIETNTIIKQSNKRPLHLKDNYSVVYKYLGKQKEEIIM